MRILARFVAIAVLATLVFAAPVDAATTPDGVIEPPGVTDPTTPPDETSTTSSTSSTTTTHDQAAQEARGDEALGRRPVGRSARRRDPDRGPARSWPRPGSCCPTTRSRPRRRSSRSSAPRST